jgi:hypothetical protein
VANLAGYADSQRHAGISAVLGETGVAMAAKRSSTKQSANEAKSDPAVSYNEFKEHEGQRYTGMKIGRSHKWHYDQGEWKEKKITPDLWQIGYAVTKRRAGRAPEGSGVPVGTEYHWYILAHQNTANKPRTTTRRPSPASSARSRTSARAARSGARRREPNASA